MTLFEPHVTEVKLGERGQLYGLNNVRNGRQKAR
jgi:hypothetical protein